MIMINSANPFLSPVRSNTNYTMYRMGGSSNANHYLVTNRNGDIVASGKRKHVVEVWNNVGTASRLPMSASV
tara:strand:- start:21 stop:236 length:216 start_codon:yes stop_codon:yes gene_type:complete